jgi:hypothetical protein
MQGVGQKMREIYSEIWVDTVFYTTIPEGSEEGFDCFVISDVRYPNEGAKIHSEGGTLIKVLRDAGGVSVGAEHSSETSMRDYEDFDFVIENNNSFEDYFEKLDTMMEEIKYGREQGQDND